MRSILLLRLFHNNKIRHVVRIICAFVIALIVNNYISFTDEGWIIMTAVFVMLTSIGSAFYQGLIRFFLLGGMVLIASLVFSTMTVALIRLDDIAIGAFIGIMANVTILPDRVDAEFRLGLIPLLKSYNAYFTSIIELLVQNNTVPAEQAKIEVEKQLQQLPAWVHEVGFDIHMQKSYRYFFMKMSQISEILFALHYLSRHPFSMALLERTQGLFLQCVLKVNQFILALITLLELQKLAEGVDDFEEEIALIERDFNQNMPTSLGLLDIEKECIYFAELIYGLKDFRRALVNVAKTLR